MSKPDPTPDSLMAAINGGPALATSLIKAAIAHVIIIGILSVPYLFQVATHGTFDVRGSIQEQQAQAAEAEREKRREDRKKEREAQVQAATSAAAAADRENADSASPTRTPGGTAKPNNPFEKEVSHERPEDTDIDIDSDFGL
jgi:hypothetical protein